jgi:hypothetical protein
MTSSITATRLLHINEKRITRDEFESLFSRMLPAYAASFAQIKPGSRRRPHSVEDGRRYRGPHRSDRCTMSDAVSRSSTTESTPVENNFINVYKLSVNKLPLSKSDYLLELHAQLLLKKK